MKNKRIALTITAMISTVILTYGLKLQAEEGATTLALLLKDYSLEAGKLDPEFKGFSEERGREIFFKEQTDSYGEKLSCGTCHTDDLKNSGKTTVGKKIDPLAPSVNPESLTDKKHIEKWLKRNFLKVYDREGTAQEKGDVLLFISKQ